MLGICNQGHPQFYIPKDTPDRYRLREIFSISIVVFGLKRGKLRRDKKLEGMKVLLDVWSSYYCIRPFSFPRFLTQCMCIICCKLCSSLLIKYYLGQGRRKGPDRTGAYSFLRAKGWSNTPRFQNFTTFLHQKAPFWTQKAHFQTEIEPLIGQFFIRTGAMHPLLEIDGCKCTRCTRAAAAPAKNNDSKTAGFPYLFVLIYVH